MRKSLKVAALIFILPVLTYDFAVFNYREAQRLNQEYILPLMLKDMGVVPVDQKTGLPPAPTRKLWQSKLNMCRNPLNNIMSCTKA